MWGVTKSVAERPIKDSLERRMRETALLLQLVIRPSPSRSKKAQGTRLNNRLCQQAALRLGGTCGFCFVATGYEPAGSCSLSPGPVSPPKTDEGPGGAAPGVSRLL